MRKQLFFVFICILKEATSQFSGDEATDINAGPTPAAGETYQIGFPECLRYDSEGNAIYVLYDQCTSICCGGRVIDNSTGVQCCGSEANGKPYHPRYETCCQWWTGHGKGHRKSSMWGNAGCCGAERVRWGENSCCYGYPDPPQIYNHNRDLCCNAHRIRAKTRYARDSACCGENASYDKRLESCPCNDGQVLSVPSSKAACCETFDGLKSPYMTETQFCCNGKVGTNGTNFCCGTNGIGTYGEQVCCGSKVFEVTPPNKNKTECCNGVAFDPKTDICCNDKVAAIQEGADKCCAGTPYNAETSICCSGSLLSRETEGTECCATFAFFPDRGSFCCNERVFQSEAVGGDTCCGTGANIDFYYKAESSNFICCNGVLGFRNTEDACCGAVPYSTTTAICCSGEIAEKTLGDSCCNDKPYFPNPGRKDGKQSICCPNGAFGPFTSPKCCGGEGHDQQGGTICCGEQVYGKFRWPSCCVDKGYDASTHTCCGSQIHPNPHESRQTGCCGDLPYDKITELCCDGVNITIPKGIPKNKAKCCDVWGVYNEDTQLCCLGQIFNKTNKWTSKCCGEQLYDSDKRICCDGQDGRQPVLNDFEYGKTNSKCCGSVLYNASVDFCCEGVLQTKEHEESGCCAGQVYDRTKQICCQSTLREIGKVPWRRADCCGNKCMYRGPQRCCHERIYVRNKRTENTCKDF